MIEFKQGNGKIGIIVKITAIAATMPTFGETIPKIPLDFPVNFLIFQGAYLYYRYIAS
jgi:hypothetical protein